MANLHSVTITNHLLLIIVEFVFITQIEILDAIDCSNWNQQNPCNQDSNGGCTWSESKCRCKSSIDNNYYLTIDHSMNISVSETDDALSFLSTIIDHGMTKNSGLGFLINYGTLTQTYGDNEDVMVQSWDDHLALLIPRLNGTGIGYNQLVYSVDATLGKLTGKSNKIGIMIASSPPCGVYTSTGNPSGGNCDNNCQLQCDINDTRICSRPFGSLQSENIRMIVIYSHPTLNYDFECIVQNSSDIFFINDSLSNTYNQLDTIKTDILNIMCPLDKYTITITEIKTSISSLNSYKSYDAPFIEILNTYSSPVNLRKLVFQGLVNGTTSHASSTRLLVGQYLVLYNADFGNITCHDCDCTKSDGILCDDAIYVPCGTSYKCIFDTSMNSTNWNIHIRDVIESSNEFIIADLSYSTTSFPSNIGDNSIELNNTEWMKSCNEHGSPGSGPLVTCSSNAPSQSPTIPSSQPTYIPSVTPTIVSSSPTDTSNDPTTDPTRNPLDYTTTDTPTTITNPPSVNTDNPTYHPTLHPTFYPSIDPTSNPSSDTNVVTVGSITTESGQAIITTEEVAFEKERNKYFRCKYRDNTASYYKEAFTLKRYAQIMMTSFLSTISNLQGSDWTYASVYYMDICGIFTNYTVNDTCAIITEKFDETDIDTLDWDEFFSFGSFGIKAQSDDLQDYKTYIFDLVSSADFLMSWTLDMNAALNNEILIRRRSLLAAEFTALSVTIKEIDSEETSTDNESFNDFQQKWIWVIIIGVIVVIVCIFFVFIFKWRMGILKAGIQHKTNSKNIKQMSPLSVQTTSVPYSEDRNFEEDEEHDTALKAGASYGDNMTSFNRLRVTPMGAPLQESRSYSNDTNNTNNNDNRIRKETAESDADVIQNMFTDNGGTGGDSMYLGSVYTETPQGPSQEESQEVSQPQQLSQAQQSQAQDKNDLTSDARSDNWNRYETNDVEMEELYRTGTELANMARRNVNNLPPQPEVDTAGGLPMSTAIGPNGKIGEKSIDPEVIRKWQSNSEDSSSDDNDKLYGKKTPFTPENPDGYHD